MPDDPITLRTRAIAGEKLAPGELHCALTHLFKRRGYTEVPWANNLESSKKGNQDAEGDVKAKVLAIVQEMATRGCLYPCQLLSMRRQEVGRHPAGKWGRQIYWPREKLEEEFRAIVEAQKKCYPQLSGKANWLLYGDTQVKSRNGKEYHVYFRAGESRNPGILGLRWPRFDNRGPALDAYKPYDEQGRPLHVARKNKAQFRSAQWVLALMNFRVLDPATSRHLDPRIHFPEFVATLQQEWDRHGKVTLGRLKKLSRPFSDKFILIEDQKPLTPDSTAGRARFASPTLDFIKSEINAGRQIIPSQPLLRRPHETREAALNRYMAEIRHPLVRHRLGLYNRLLLQLVSKHGKPDFIIVEAVRSLALGRKAKQKLNKQNEQYRAEREQARNDLADEGIFPTRQAILRYRLWKEAHGICPICLQTINRAALGDSADIAHIVPRARVDCNESYNLTITHIHCNRNLQLDRTPFEAFGKSEEWNAIAKNAAARFTGLKRELFLSPNAEELIEQKADLQHTAYIARVIRHITLIQLGWISKEGRDPTMETGNKPSVAFQVTNGQITSRLRQAWGLNHLLNPLPEGQRWDDLTPDEQNRCQTKNRADLRHHALDAMVIACTLPWLAHRTVGAMDENQNHGWWTMDERGRSHAANPVFPRPNQMHDICQAIIPRINIRHHASRRPHRSGYFTTLLGKRDANVYVCREKLNTLKPMNFRDVYPPELGEYLITAWSHFTADANAADEKQKNKGQLPDHFIEKLCFAHFQRWREAARKSNTTPQFKWPERPIIPIRTVKLVSVKDDRSVMPVHADIKAFVKRDGYREARIHLSADSIRLVPVLIPFGKSDQPIMIHPIAPDKRPYHVLRVNDTVHLVTSPGTGKPAGKYIIKSTRQNQIQLLPVHLSGDADGLVAAGFPENGVQLTWQQYFKHAGYELPNHPSDKA